jgi:hypothetical protein
MTEREKELFKDIDNWYKNKFGRNLEYDDEISDMEGLSKTLIQTGYTKKHFPIEKLKKRLRELQEANPVTHPDGCPYPYRTIDFFPDLFEIIKELEEKDG